MRLTGSLAAMSFFGVGQVFSGIIMGKIIDRFGSRKAVFMNILALAVCISIQITSIYQRTYIIWLNFTACFLWGFQDGVVNTHAF